MSKKFTLKITNNLKAKTLKDINNQTVDDSQDLIDKRALGQELLHAGFSVWFRYMFRVLEGLSLIHI